MALQLNLLHEQISEERQRRRDPLKLGIIALCAFGAILFLYYGWKVYQTLQIKSQLRAAQSEWAKVEPKVTAAQKRADELHKIIDGTKVLDGLIESRFYWAPLLATLSHCVAPNIQLISFDGTFTDGNKPIALLVEGIAAAREPRGAAEEFRQLLMEQLAKNYSDVKVDFRNLEDLDTVVKLAGVPTASARFVLNVSFSPTPPAPSAATPAASATPAPEIKK
ncbi:MAG TPA: hypothetical protein VGI85_06630 [Chthoniobacterales bacterium]|jgi:hypothetical protein